MNRLYCGDRNPLPDGYAGYDTRYNCLRKGVGIGKAIAQNATNGNVILRKTPVAPHSHEPSFFKKIPWYIYLIIGLLVLIIIIIIVLYIFRK